MIDLGVATVMPSDWFRRQEVKDSEGSWRGVDGSHVGRLGEHLLRYRRTWRTEVGCWFAQGYIQNARRKDRLSLREDMAYMVSGNEMGLLTRSGPFVGSNNMNV